LLLREGRWKAPALGLVANGFSLLLSLQLAIVQTTTRKHVLVLYESNRLLPANIERDRGLNEQEATEPVNRTVDEKFSGFPSFAQSDELARMANSVCLPECTKR
jgi:hypothetical protein